LQSPNMSPIPETANPQLLLLTALSSTLVVIGMRRRRIASRRQLRH
jgi:hypothetical protein